MKSSDVRRKYIDFFKASPRGHVVIPSASLVPENDPTTLFTSSGMQPLVPYLLGQPHPLGSRLVNSQKSFRAQDIEEVGDLSHTTFFEMLGNWSLGDPSAQDGIRAGYFKKEQLPWIFEFLTRELGLDPQRLYVSVFEGDQSVPEDTESIHIWKKIFAGGGVEAKEGERIFTYPADKNWWSRTGEPSTMPPGEPGGPDSEVFFDLGIEHGFHEVSPHQNEPCHPNCQCGRFMEIANSVFMQYQKQTDGSLKELPQKNVDFGAGLERLVAATNHDPDIFNTDLFSSAKKILEDADTVRSLGSKVSIRVILDHIRAAMFIIDAGVEPSNKAQGYVLRRLIRRAALHSKIANLDLDKGPSTPILRAFGEVYLSIYPTINENLGYISKIIAEELERFEKTLVLGMRQIESRPKGSVISGTELFNFYQTYGYPPELVKELALHKDIQVDMTGFEEARKNHQEKSRMTSAGMFKGGLADQSEETTKLHTATHLLHAALRQILGSHIQQKGSNITVERLRFDFSHPAKLTPEELKKVEDLVNEKIKENLPVSTEVMDKEKALTSGALAFFGERYGDKVKVYSMGDFSREICGGPHVAFTGELGHFTITKEESAGAGVRRIYATLK